MKFIEKKLKNESSSAPASHLFIDIETTGLKIDTTMPYLIGTACVRGDEIEFRQWLIESPSEVRDALDDIITYSSNFDTFVSFNGDRFDLPYLDYHAKNCGLNSPFLTMNSLDIFKRIKCLKNLFSMSGAGQKCFEEFIGDGRIDNESGGDLINVYYDYLQTGSDEALAKILLHNEEDVLGMPRLLALFPYANLHDKVVDIISAAPAVISQSDDELLLQFRTNDTYKYKVSKFFDKYYISIDGNYINLKLPLLTGRLKYFYPHAREYYYLPKEDMAVHKSVGTYVDHAFRQQATAETCYVKKEGTFVPLIKDNYSEIFRDCAKGAPYAILKDELLKDVSFWNAYLHDLFNMITSSSPGRKTALKSPR